MIVVSLWWWSDLNEAWTETPLSRAFRAWRLPTQSVAPPAIFCNRRAAAVPGRTSQHCVGVAFSQRATRSARHVDRWSGRNLLRVSSVSLRRISVAAARRPTIANICGGLLYFAVLSYYATVLLPSKSAEGGGASPAQFMIVVSLWWWSDFTPIGCA